MRDAAQVVRTTKIPKNHAVAVRTSWLRHAQRPLMVMGWCAPPVRSSVHLGSREPCESPLRAHRRWIYDLKGVARIVEVAEAGTSPLPAPLRDESYAAYLRRVPLEAGLHAEALWATAVSVDTMLQEQALIEARGGDLSLSVCLSSFMGGVDECRASIAAVYARLPLAAAEVAAAVDAAAPGTCIHDAAGATEGEGGDGRRALREADHTTSSEGLARSKSEMALYLHEIDRQLLGGRLEAAASQIDCPLSPEYDLVGGAQPV